MPRRTSIPVELTPDQQGLLDRLHEGDLSLKSAIRKALRVEVVTRAARGDTNYMIAKQLGISRNTVKLWRYRFAREGVVGLESRPIPGRPPKRRDALAAAAQEVPGQDLT
jgi:transposase